MSDDLNCDDIIKLLALEPNATCGFVRITYTSRLSFGSDVLPPPFARPGPVGSALYFLVTPHAPVRRSGRERLPKRRQVAGSCARWSLARAHYD
jgi:hypothetical protein